MRQGYLASGGRYPVLRAIAILYFVGAVISLLGGIAVAAFFAVRGDPFNLVGGRLLLCVETLTGAFFTSIALLAVAELIKLLIDIEHNSRIGALSSAAGAAAAAGPTDGKNRLTWMQGEETAEGALLRGH